MRTLSQDDIREAFRGHMRRTGVAISAWAAKAGIKDQTLGQFIRNVSKSMRDANVRKLEEAAEKTVEQMLAENEMETGGGLAQMQHVSGMIQDIERRLSELRGLLERIPGVIAKDTQGMSQIEIDAYAEELAKAATSAEPAETLRERARRTGTPED